MFYFNLILALGIQLWPLWISRKVLRLSWINPFTICMAPHILLEWVKILSLLAIDFNFFANNIGFHFSLAVNNLGVFLKIIVIWFVYKFSLLVRAENIIPRGRNISQGLIRRLEKVFLVVYLVSFYFLSSAEYGLVNWLINPRAGYQFYRAGHGHWYAICISALAAAYAMFYLSNPKPKKLILRSNFYIILSFILGSKGLVLSYVVATLVYLSFLGYRRIVFFIFLFSILLLAMMFYNFYLVFGEFLEARVFLEYFDYYKNASMFYEDYLRGSIQLFGGEVFLSSFWSFVPRFLYPEKPFVYGVLLVNEIYYPGLAEQGHTPAFGGMVEKFADFGLAGVVFFQLLDLGNVSLGLILYLVFKKGLLDSKRVSYLSVLIVLYQFSASFGLFFEGILFFVPFMFVVIIVIIAKLFDSIIRGGVKHQVQQQNH